MKNIQKITGTFEWTMSQFIDREVDLSGFDESYNNDEKRAPAYEPRIMLKIVDKYKEPEGAFIIAKDNNTIIGIIGLKKLENKICEMKRLFVSDNYKGKSIGKKLVEIIINEAKLKHYEKMRLDTLDTMETALKIYYGNGFYRIEPYYNNPSDRAVYLEKIL